MDDILKQVHQIQQMHPPYPLMRIFTFGEFAIERLLPSSLPSPTPSTHTHYMRLAWEEWDHRKPAMTLLKVLLCRAQRQATRQELIETIWPGKKTINATHALDSAASVLRRRVLWTHTSESLLHTSHDAGETSFRLAPQERLWIDADAFLALATQATLAESLEQNPLPILEAAYALARGGSFLEDDRRHIWAQGRRQTLNGARHRVLYKLVDLYLQRKLLSQAEELLFAFLEEHPTDEDVLCRLLILLANNERRQEALGVYQYTADVLREENREPSPRTLEIVHCLRQGQPVIIREPTDNYAPDQKIVSCEPSKIAHHTKRRCFMHVEVDKFCYGNYQFIVELDTGAETGANQLTTYVAEKVNIDAVPLTQFTTHQLLNALLEPRHARLFSQLVAEKRVCQQPFENEIAVLQELHTKPGQKLSGKLKKQMHTLRGEMKSAVQRLETEFARRELHSLERLAFDPAILQAQSHLFGDWSRLRDFYFEETNNKHIRNFCQKFATDEAYRQVVLLHETHWAKRNALFVRNLFPILEKEVLLVPTNTRSYDRKAHQFFQWIDIHAETILALPEYQRLQTLDRPLQATSGPIDPLIRPAIETLNLIPGITTQFSCQGVSGKVHFQDHDLLAVSAHEEYAYVSFSSLGHSAYQTIMGLLPDFPNITHARVPHALGMTLRSTGNNLRFREELVILGRCVLASVDEHWCTLPYEEKKTSWAYSSSSLPRITPRSATSAGILPERLIWLCQPEQIEHTLHLLSYLNHWAKARERFLYVDRQGLYIVKAALLQQAYQLGTITPTGYIDGTEAFASDYSFEMAVDIASEVLSERLTLALSSSAKDEDELDQVAQKLFSRITETQMLEKIDVETFDDKQHQTIIKSYIAQCLQSLVEQARTSRQPIPAGELEALFIWPMDLLNIEGSRGRTWLEWHELEAADARKLDPEGLSLIAFRHQSPHVEYVFHLPLRIAETFLPAALITTLREQPHSSRERCVYYGHAISEEERQKYPIERILHDLEVDIASVFPYGLIEKTEYISQTARPYFYNDDWDDEDGWEDEDLVELFFLPRRRSGKKRKSKFRQLAKDPLACPLCHQKVELAGLPRIKHWRQAHGEHDIIASHGSWILGKSKDVLKTLSPDYRGPIEHIGELGTRFWSLTTLEQSLKQDAPGPDEETRDAGE